MGGACDGVVPVLSPAAPKGPGSFVVWGAGDKTGGLSGMVVGGGVVVADNSHRLNDL